MLYSHIICYLVKISNLAGRKREIEVYDILSIKTRYGLTENHSL
jgi:hypothetical protein